MTEEILNEPSVQSGVSEHVPGTVPKHVRMDVETDTSGLTSLLHNARHHVGTERTAALTGEHVGAIHGLPELPQAHDFIAVEGKRRRAVTSPTAAKTVSEVTKKFDARMMPSCPRSNHRAISVNHPTSRTNY